MYYFLFMRKQSYHFNIYFFIIFFTYYSRSPPTQDNASLSNLLFFDNSFYIQVKIYNQPCHYLSLKCNFLIFLILIIHALIYVIKMKLLSKEPTNKPFSHRRNHQTSGKRSQKERKNRAEYINLKGIMSNPCCHPDSCFMLLKGNRVLQHIHLSLCKRQLPLLLPFYDDWAALNRNEFTGNVRPSRCHHTWVNIIW